MSPVTRKWKELLEMVETRVADKAEVTAVKQIADALRGELGFHAIQAFCESVDRGELIVAVENGSICGFVRFHHRRDRITTIYEIATTSGMRRRGIGRRLMNAVYGDCQRTGSRLLRLSCPVELSANKFYEDVGMRRRLRHSVAGKNRPLYSWESIVTHKRPLDFVASMTVSTNDLSQLIRLWEAEAFGRPFDACIVTPLFADPGAMQSIRYMHDSWGVKTCFDSGGFFVQQGKIKYEELFARLLKFYLANDWADGYVLPDYVPTSRESPAEVSERVHVTATEGVKFYKRLPADLRERAVGVLQGRTHEHLALCFRAFSECGIARIGFGSFDTGGVNAEINLVTESSLKRLAFVRELMFRHHRLADTPMPHLHLFGVSAPGIVKTFPDYCATSFDSSGWIRTAGLGNVYLPFQSRRNVTYGSTSLVNGRGLSATAFYAECERTSHSCVFCENFARLQNDRLARIWHNAIVFREMTATIREGASNLAYGRELPA